jgi:uncharacterized damage-inducible protein DinB
MTATDVIRRLHQHRNWVNTQLMTAAATLSANQLHQRFDIGQGSIWKTLVHLYAAEWVWLETLLGDEFPILPGDIPGKLPGNQEAPGAIASFAELQEKWKVLDARWSGYLQSLTDETLDETIYKISTSSGAGKRFPTRRADVLIHVSTHAQYTAAQLVNMLRRTGATKFPETMLITLARQEVGPLS